MAENIKFELTIDQAKQICEHFNKDYSQMDEWEICELLDKVIDSLD